MSATIICPYVFEEEISALKEAYWELPFVFERDTHKIGSDLMFERMWNNCDTDIIIFHADMRHYEDDGETLWYEELCSYAEKYPEAGLLGMKLLYPAKNDAGHHWIESAGGRFDENGNPEHFGSGLDMNTQQFWKEPEQDAGQYDHVREVAWTTFGGVYIRREVINQVGNFDRSFEWTYNRDVDYCLSAREKGWKIYQVPTRLLHWQSRDNRRVATQGNRDAETRNKDRVLTKWADSPLWKTLNERVAHREDGEFDV